MSTYPTYLLKVAQIDLPLIGFYDAPDPAPFKPVVQPKPGKWACVFMFYKSWLAGKTLQCQRDNYGCGGMGTYLFDTVTRSREEYIRFLREDEGLKATDDLMAEWIDDSTHYQPEHPYLFFGPMKEDQYAYLKSITFLVNPDQLSLLVTGAHYQQGRFDPTTILVPFASGCGLLGPFFDDMNKPQAIIGSTDIAMRKYFPHDIMAFTVTKPMYEQLCSLDEKSFLSKPFWQKVVKARNK